MLPRRSRSLTELRSRDIFRLAPRVWPFIRPFKRHLLYLALGVVPGLPGGLFALSLLGVFFDAVGQGKPLNQFQAWMLFVPMTADRHVILWHACVFTGLMMVVTIPYGLALVAYGIWILQRMTNQFRVDLYTRLQELSLRFHSEEKIGDAIFRMFQDSAAIPHVINGLIIQPLHAVPLVLVNILVLAAFDYHVAAIAMALIPANLIIAGLFAKAAAARIPRRTRRHGTGDHSHRGDARIDQGGESLCREASESESLRARQLGIIHGGTPRADAVRGLSRKHQHPALARVRRCDLLRRASGPVWRSRGCDPRRIFAGRLPGRAVDLRRHERAGAQYDASLGHAPGDVGVALSRVFEMMARAARGETSAAAGVEVPHTPASEFGIRPMSASPTTRDPSFSARSELSCESRPDHCDCGTQRLGQEHARSADAALLRIRSRAASPSMGMTSAISSLRTTGE